MREISKDTGQNKKSYYFGARYYDPKISNWISTDPALRDYFNDTKEAKGGDVTIITERLKKFNITKDVVNTGVLVHEMAHLDQLEKLSTSKEPKIKNMPKDREKMANSATEQILRKASANF